MKNVVLILTGSIASIKYKRIITLLSSKYNVSIIYTNSAKMFINQHDVINSVDKVYSDDFSVDELKNIDHINLAKNTDLLLIAPCSYDYLNKISMGVADTFSLSMIAAIEKKKIMIAPAMNTNMYENPILQKSITILKEYKVKFIDPDVGLLSCGDLGIGKLAKIRDIGKHVDLFFSNSLKKKIIITGGSTKLYIDPVRYISNNSSGKFSKYLIKSALKQDFEVHYIHGDNVDVSDISDYVLCHKVSTNKQLEDAISSINDPYAIIMNIAPVDYQYKKVDQKIKSEFLELKLEKANDIISNVTGMIKFGFALETNNHYDNGLKKLSSKNLDFIMVNDAITMGSEKIYMGKIISKEETIDIGNIDKKDAADMIIDILVR